MLLLNLKAYIPIIRESSSSAMPPLPLVWANSPRLTAAPSLVASAPRIVSSHFRSGNIRRTHPAIADQIRLRPQVVLDLLAPGHQALVVAAPPRVERHEAHKVLAVRAVVRRGAGGEVSDEGLVLLALLDGARVRHALHRVNEPARGEVSGRNTPNPV